MSDRWFVQYVWVIPLLPLVSSIVTAVLGPTVLKQKSHLPCLVSIACAAVFSLAVMISLALSNPVGADSPDGVVTTTSNGVQDSGHLIKQGTTVLYNWIDAGVLRVPVVLRVDPLSSLMLVMVTCVGCAIVVFASGYMEGDPGYWRFFCYISLFLFSMTMLVLASNFLLLFVFWEAVGLCSYLLIGFWYQRPAAAAAAKKAFLVNRIGDFGFALGILMIWLTFGSLPTQDGAGQLDFAHAFAHVTDLSSTPEGQFSITVICLMLFGGAAGKSAQFPLHVWLPDAMEGPTPVSALIHAATMVTAGVYMVARLSVFFFASPTAQLVVAGIGGFTALMAALIAMTQTDLKRILAYSTLSQLGYMFLALGCGSTMAVIAAVFHVFTHAFFKALLFLGAGSVMHSMGNVIDIRKFGGLRRLMPVTYVTFACGAASLAGLPLLSGFWSKDEILSGVAERAGSGDPSSAFYGLLLATGVVTAFLTAFYTFRAFFMTFLGDEVVPEQAGAHAHESPRVMTIPLVVLAVFAVALGVVIGPTGWIAGFLSGTQGLSHTGDHHLNWSLMTLSGALALAGSGLAWWVYGRPTDMATGLVSKLKPIHNLLVHKFWVDELYGVVVVAPLVMFADICAFVDRWLVDGLVNLIAIMPRTVGRVLLRPIQNGLVQFYALGMFMGLVMLVIAMWYGS